ncbi:MAG: stage II sporulation protein P [Lachnospiraceae bacterium]
MHRKLRTRKMQMISAVLLTVLLCSYMGTAQEQIVGMCIPMLLYTDHRRNVNIGLDWMIEKIYRQMPFYRYLSDETQYEVIAEDESTYELILQMEGTEEDREKADLKEAELEEAELVKDDAGVQSAVTEKTEPNPVFVEEKVKQQEFQMEDIGDFKSLVSHFYAIDATTMTDEKQLNATYLLSQDMRLVQDAGAPQILIYHTHASEAFADSIPGDTSMSVVGAGEKLAVLLREKYGYNVIHDTGQYDQVRAQAYNVAAPALEQILADNPSIEVIIDLHRDQMQADKKLLVELQGRPTAQFMFFNGLSRTRERGDITSLKNPYIDQNLAFSLQMQMACNTYYPGLTRRIYLKGYRYNMHYRPKTLLIELGAQTNTTEEVQNAIDPIAHVLHLVLSGEGTSNFVKQTEVS